MAFVRRLLAPDAAIWLATVVLALLLGAVSASMVGNAVQHAGGAGNQTLQALTLVIAGTALIVLAIRGTLMRLFLSAFASVFVISTLMIVRW